jgi:hypothetical protein
MKKLVLLAVLGASIASCRKDRTCTCVNTSDAPGYVSSTDVQVIYDSKKKDARVGCQSYSEKITTTGAQPYTYTYTCELK